MELPAPASHEPAWACPRPIGKKPGQGARRFFCGPADPEEPPHRPGRRRRSMDEATAAELRGLRRARLREIPRRRRRAGVGSPADTNCLGACKSAFTPQAPKERCPCPIPLWPAFVLDTSRHGRRIRATHGPERCGISASKGCGSWRRGDGAETASAVALASGAGRFGGAHGSARWRTRGRLAYVTPRTGATAGTPTKPVLTPEAAIASNAATGWPAGEGGGDVRPGKGGMEMQIAGASAIVTADVNPDFPSINLG